MNWNIEYLADEGIIELVVRGSVTLEDVRESTDAALELIKSEQCFAVLLNCLKLKQPPAPSVVQKLPEYYAAHGMDSRLRIGLVGSGSAEGLEVSQFYKLSAKQRNFSVQLFDSREDALQWLKN